MKSSPMGLWHDLTRILLERTWPDRRSHGRAHRRGCRVRRAWPAFNPNQRLTAKDLADLLGDDIDEVPGGIFIPAGQCDELCGLVPHPAHRANDSGRDSTRDGADGALNKARRDGPVRNKCPDVVFSG